MRIIINMLVAIGAIVTVVLVIGIILTIVILVSGDKKKEEDDPESMETYYCAQFECACFTDEKVKSCMECELLRKESKD